MRDLEAALEELKTKLAPRQHLSHAIAHEMGHLLLGSTPYDAVGIMHEPWTTEELERLRMGTLLFSTEESILIRCELTSRIRRK